MSVFFREPARFYNAFGAGRNVTLPELPIQHTDMPRFRFSPFCEANRTYVTFCKPLGLASKAGAGKLFFKPLIGEMGLWLDSPAGREFLTGGHRDNREPWLESEAGGQTFIRQDDRMPRMGFDLTRKPGTWIN